MKALAAKLNFYEKMVGVLMSAIIVLLSTGVGVIFSIKTDVSMLLAYRASDVIRINDNTMRIYELEKLHRERRPQDPEKISYLPKHIIKPDQRMDPKRAIRLAQTR